MLIDVHYCDVDRWIAFFQQFGVDMTINEHPDADDVDGNVHYVLFLKADGIDVEWVDGNPVIPLDDAIDQMMENRPAYEPALEIIGEEDDRDIEASYPRASSPLRDETP